LINIARPYIGEEEKKAVMEVLESDCWPKDRWWKDLKRLLQSIAAFLTLLLPRPGPRRYTWRYWPME
jgi:hypothetical protein